MAPLHQGNGSSFCACPMYNQISHYEIFSHTHKTCFAVSGGSVSGNYTLIFERCSTLVKKVRCPLIFSLLQLTKHFEFLFFSLDYISVRTRDGTPYSAQIIRTVSALVAPASHDSGCMRYLCGAMKSELQCFVLMRETFIIYQALRVDFSGTNRPESIVPRSSKIK